MAKTVNYTDEQLDLAKSMYAELGNEGMAEIAAAIGKAERSVRSKLVREGVYIATPKAVTVRKDTGPTKKELLNQLESIVGFDVTPLQGATKEGLQSLIEYAQAQEVQEA